MISILFQSFLLDSYINEKNPSQKNQIQEDSTCCFVDPIIVLLEVEVDVETLSR